MAGPGQWSWGIMPGVSWRVLMPKTKTNGNGRLAETVATLNQSVANLNQAMAAFLTNQTAFSARMAQTDAQLPETTGQMHNTNRILSKQYAHIKTLPLEHA